MMIFMIKTKSCFYDDASFMSHMPIHYFHVVTEGRMSFLPLSLKLGMELNGWRCGEHLGGVEGEETDQNTLSEMIFSIKNTK